MTNNINNTNRSLLFVFVSLSLSLSLSHSLRQQNLWQGKLNSHTLLVLKHNIYNIYCDINRKNHRDPHLLSSPSLFRFSFIKRSKQRRGSFFSHLLLIGYHIVGPTHLNLSLSVLGCRERDIAVPSSWRSATKVWPFLIIHWVNFSGFCSKHCCVLVSYIMASIFLGFASNFHICKFHLWSFFLFFFLFFWGLFVVLFLSYSYILQGHLFVKKFFITLSKLFLACFWRGQTSGLSFKFIYVWMVNCHYSQIYSFCLV